MKNLIIMDSQRTCKISKTSIIGTLKIFQLSLALIALTYISCKKLVDVKAPVTSVNAANAYTTDASAISVVTTMYKRMSSNQEGFTGLRSISLMTGLSADEFTLYNGVTDLTYIAYYQNSLVANNSQNYGSEFWSQFYNYIYVCNSAIEGMSTSSGLTPGVKQQLLGEVKFMRAFIYFYLVNMYGNVPLVVTTDWNINSKISNASKEQIYQQIISDLKDAEGLLSENYLDGTLQNAAPDKLRPTKWAAIAMLARVYLYNGDFSNAVSKASALINSNLFSLDSLNGTFLKNSNEAIWQLQPTVSGHNTEDAWMFIIPSTGPNNIAGHSTGQPVYLSSSLLNSFEVADQRKLSWINNVAVNGNTYYYPYKYKSATLNAPITEYLMVLRLGEQYLIRAEAEAQQNKISESQADLNVIRTRAGLSDTNATNQSSLLSAIIHERQVELFSEWGHRWFDLKRTGNIDAVMSVVTPQKGGIWQTTDQLYPILFADILRNPNLKQNTGY
ncbi:MAG: RagB/SusD family nutrient uptake outer membrane protein [Chitinophagaceae bacterium]